MGRSKTKFSSCKHSFFATQRRPLRLHLVVVFFQWHPTQRQRNIFAPPLSTSLSLLFLSLVLFIPLLLVLLVLLVCLFCGFFFCVRALVLIVLLPATLRLRLLVGFCVLK